MTSVTTMRGDVSNSARFTVCWQVFYTVRAMTGAAHPLAVCGRDNIRLVLRTVFLIFTDFGMLVGPFVPSQYFWRIQSWAYQLLFTKPGMHVSVVTFLQQFPTDVPLAGAAQANYKVFPYFFALVLLRNLMWAIELHSLLS